MTSTHWILGLCYFNIVCSKWSVFPCHMLSVSVLISNVSLKFVLFFSGLFCVLTYILHLREIWQVWPCLYFSVLYVCKTKWWCITGCHKNALVNSCNFTGYNESVLPPKSAWLILMKWRFCIDFQPCHHVHFKSYIKPIQMLHRDSIKDPIHVYINFLLLGLDRVIWHLLQVQSLQTVNSLIMIIILWKWKVSLLWK
jgi:hypothetical protein